jgi:hypothetical protein
VPAAIKSLAAHLGDGDPGAPPCACSSSATASRRTNEIDTTTLDPFMVEQMTSA